MCWSRASTRIRACTRRTPSTRSAEPPARSGGNRRGKKEARRSRPAGSSSTLGSRDPQHSSWLRRSEPCTGGDRTGVDRKSCRPARRLAQRSAGSAGQQLKGPTGAHRWAQLTRSESGSPAQLSRLYRSEPRPGSRPNSGVAGICARAARGRGAPRRPSRRVLEPRTSAARRPLKTSGRVALGFPNFSLSLSLTPPLEPPLRAALAGERSLLPILRATRPRGPNAGARKCSIRPRRGQRARTRTKRSRPRSRAACSRLGSCDVGAARWRPRRTGESRGPRRTERAHRCSQRSDPQPLPNRPTVSVLRMSAVSVHMSSPVLMFTAVM
jgi:hypothetical protein